MRLSSETIRNATGGIWHGTPPAMIEAIATDSREFVAGQTFLALRGPHFDGHAFARDIADRAAAMIGDHRGITLWHGLDVPQLEVDDTLEALGAIAASWRQRLQHTRLIAITGSFGKTSLRSLLEHALARLGYRVCATRGNLNNLIGVPQTLLAIEPQADFAIVECGISETGEMQRLARMVQPDIAVITGLAQAHASGLGDLAGIARQKAMLLEHLRPGGWCALGEGVSQKLHAFGLDPACDCLSAESPDAVRWNLAGRRLRLKQGGQVADMELALPARHWGANMALAAGLLLRLLNSGGHGVDLNAIASALADWQAEPGRLRVITLPDGVCLLDDCYNANPASMQAALDTLAAMPAPRMAILGDMAELGSAAEAAHRSLRLENIEHVLLVGPQMKALADQCANALWFMTTDQALAHLERTPLPRHVTVLVKASRSMGLERIVRLLSGQPAAREEKAHAV